MAVYNFTKSVLLSQLEKEIKANSSLAATFLSTSKLSDDLSITFSSELSTELQDALSAIITNHVPGTPVPEAVTPRQIRLALVASGFSLANIEAGLNSLSEPQKTAALIAWEFSTEFYRSNPLIISIGPLLGFTPTQLDQLFILAETL